MPRPRAPWWMYLFAASFLIYLPVMIYNDFYGPEPIGWTSKYDGKAMTVVAVSSNSATPAEPFLRALNAETLIIIAPMQPVEPPPPLFAAHSVRGFVLQDSCRCYEFRVTSLDDREERTRIDAEL